MSAQEQGEEDEGGNEELLGENEDVKKLKEELSKTEDLYLRTLADFENYRKRIERDKERTNAEKERIVLSELLEVVDSFEKAFYSFSEDKAIEEALLPLYNQLLGVLDRRGIFSFECLGEEFNPEIHEAIMATQSDKYPSGTIVGEIQKGYMIGEEVLRLARVQVVNND